MYQGCIRGVRAVSLTSDTNLRFVKGCSIFATNKSSPGHCLAMLTRGAVSIRGVRGVSAVNEGRNVWQDHLFFFEMINN